MKPLRSTQLACIALCACFFPIRAQMHYNAWFRITLGFSVSKKIKIDAELQHRRQNGFGNFNMMDENLLFSARTWIHYQHKPAIRLSVSPFSCFRHYKPVLNKSDENAGASEEIRFALAAELRPKITERINMFYRTSLEYRLPGNYRNSMIRLRNRLGCMYRVKQKLKMFAYEELFLNVNGIHREHVFDHNRIAIGFEYEITKDLKTEAGSIYITRLPLQTGNLLYEASVFLNFIYSIGKN